MYDWYLLRFTYTMGLSYSPRFFTNIFMIWIPRIFGILGIPLVLIIRSLFNIGWSEVLEIIPYAIYLTSAIIMSYFFACFLYELWRKHNFSKISVILIFIILIVPLFIPAKKVPPNYPLTKLMVLQAKCYAGTNQLGLIIINDGGKTVDMIPLDVLVYNSSGDIIPITKVNLNESSISNATAWNLAQNPEGYTGEINLTLSNNFKKGEYLRITLCFKNSNYSVDTDCLAK